MGQGRRPRSWSRWVCGRRLGSRWAIPVVKLVGRRSLSISLSSRVVHGPSEASQPVAARGHRPHIHGLARERSDRAGRSPESKPVGRRSRRRRSRLCEAKSSEYTQALSGPPEAPPCAAPVEPVGHQKGGAGQLSLIHISLFHTTSLVHATIITARGKIVNTHGVRYLSLAVIDLTYEHKKETINTRAA